MSGKIYRWKGNNEQIKVVCLPGFMGSGSDFQIMKDHFHNHPEIVALDFPDYKQESVQAIQSWETVIKELNQFLETECGDTQCLLLGYSMGGRIALQYALKKPEYLKGLILIGSTAGIMEEADRKIRIKQDEDLASRLLSQPLDRFLEFWFNQPLLETQKKIQEPYASRMVQIRRGHSKKAIAHYLAKLGTGTMPPVWDQLHKLTIPSLLITGQEDQKFADIAASIRA